MAALRGQRCAARARSRLRRGAAAPALLMDEGHSSAIVGVDVSHGALERAGAPARPGPPALAGDARRASSSRARSPTATRGSPASTRRRSSRSSSTSTRRGCARFERGRVRARPPRHGRPDDAERRVQRALRDSGRRAAPAPRPPLRVDARRVPGLGGRRVATATATRCASCRSARAIRSSARRPRWRCSPDDALEHPGALARRPDRAVRLRQVDVRARALHADRGPLVGLSAAASSPTTRTTRRPRADAFEVLHFIAGQAPRRAAG